MWAVGYDTYHVLRELYKTGRPVGNSLNRKLMRDFRIYMAVGGMPQAVEVYTEGKNFTEIDEVKREIIDLYKDDFFKIDNTGLFTTMIFNSSGETDTNIYTKLLSDSLPADLGYLYENAAAQIIAGSDIALFYYTWEKENSSHYYEVDFLLPSKTKIVPLEIKSSGIGKHESITAFQKKYSKQVLRQILLSQKDIGHAETLQLYPVYMLPFILEDLKN